MFEKVMYACCVFSGGEKYFWKFKRNRTQTETPNALMETGCKVRKRIVKFDNKMLNEIHEIFAWMDSRMDAQT